MNRRGEGGCRACLRAIVNPEFRLRQVCPDCWQILTPAERTAAMKLEAAARDPFRIPAERAPSPTARVNHRNARAALRGDVQVCERHGGELGKCPLCKWEAAPENASKLILREVLSWTFEQRRAERARVLAARYAYVTPWRPAERPQRPQKPKTPPQDRPRRTAPPTGQLELS